MSKTHAAPAALDGVRVLDASGLAGQYCGKLLAQLGADVVLVEPPGGSPVRREGPYLKQQPHIEHSLPFAYFNEGKRGICLDLDHADGQALMRQLAARADIVIESAGAGVMEKRGLGYSALAGGHAGLVVTSISPFGQTGPYAQYKADELVAMALGGLLYLGGYPDSEPVMAYGNQAYLAAAQFAAVGTLIALWEAERADGGQGQHVDVSIQECVTMALENAAQFVDLEGVVRKRTAGQQRQAGTGVFPCKDGMVYLMAGGIAANRFWAATAQWLIDVEAPQAHELLEPRWNDTAYLASDEAKARFERVFLPYAMQHTKADLYQDGQRRRIPICPVSTCADLLENRQLAYRQFFGTMQHPYSGLELIRPGAPFRLSATPWRAGRPAPRLGEHTAQVLGELGLDGQTQQVLLRAGVTG
ncbi:CaiB/BaiF CoA transferase family protein [Bordetella petrii]|uniref:CaiB/BaiF CoA transferase family protein n=1 Tax=Bordetella petrii TaxID=94624 RepID=UPI001E649485|nr:CoA transferase [Bordetella petrii]MCD0502649.1 CoA transferase [Bordetella petrii]